MLKRFKIFTIAVAALTIVTTAAWITTNGSLAQGRQESATGHGTTLVQDEQSNTVRRQFSFNARRFADGSVKGNAVLNNPAFSGANGKKFQVKIEISCLKVVGNTAIFGGTTRRSNDPNLVDTVFFSVEDNGEPGKDNDRISGLFFNDDDPTAEPGDPQTCQTFDPIDFEPLSVIDGGNIQVKGSVAR